ncbi:hypothetical protein HRI_002159900 [Hibiscus trionum]|uniref:Uncharacterized protein n=1 Tax=Hibiscus trionum TaxID=183268 RepID=A0A9W7M282_HIBTR|nr:hypothetical protein HRI_002159900 [Hibiscus trionum]
MRRRERGQSNLLLNHSSEDLDAPLGSKPGALPIFNLSASATTRVRNTARVVRLMVFLIAIVIKTTMNGFS